MGKKIDINLIGGGFNHSPSTSGFETKYVNWIKGPLTASVSMYVDVSIQGPIKTSNAKNYAWLAESKTIQPQLYGWCVDNVETLRKKFIKVFTHDKSLVDLDDLFILTQTSCKSFINPKEFNIYNKSKLLSMIASNKNRCVEHSYRQQIVKKYSSLCDHFGFGYDPIPNKIDGLKNYGFSIAMENGLYPNMYSEKITDCFVTGTIPIYYGIENIDDFFNSDGIIMLNDFEINELSFELYQSKMNAIKENFEIAKNLLNAEDYIYINFLKYEI